jgi:hypothetical protein
MSPHSYSQFIFDKGVKDLHWREGISSTNAVGKTGYPHIAAKFRLLSLTLYKT